MCTNAGNAREHLKMTSAQAQNVAYNIYFRNFIEFSIRTILINNFTFKVTHY